MKTVEDILKTKTEHQYFLEGAPLQSGIDYADAVEAMKEYANQFKLELDAIRDEFYKAQQKKYDKAGFRMSDKAIFDFFLSYLQENKAVEVADKETLYKWTKASEKHPPINAIVVVKDEDGTTYEDSTTTGWDKNITNYSWLEEIKQGIAPCKEVEEKCIEPIVFTEETVLIATQECLMNFTKLPALIIGKEYKIKGFYSGQFVIKSEVDDKHYFELDKFTNYFKLKEGEEKQ